MSIRRKIDRLALDMVQARLWAYAAQVPEWLTEEPFKLDPHMTRLARAAFQEKIALAKLSIVNQFAFRSAFVAAHRGEIHPDSLEATFLKARKSVEDLPLFRLARVNKAMKDKLKLVSPPRKDTKTIFDLIDQLALPEKLEPPKAALADVVHPLEKKAMSAHHIYVFRNNREGPAGSASDRVHAEFCRKLAEPKMLEGAAKADELDGIYARLYARAPWHREFLAWAYEEQKESYRRGECFFHLPPCLIVGPPGIGKTFVVHELAKESGVASARIDMASRGSPFDITGLEKGWGNSSPGIPVRLVVDRGSANPLILLDEIEKAGQGVNAGSPLDALLTLLETETASRFLCPYAQGSVDLSRLSFVATANSLDRLSPAILDRFRVIHISHPKGRDLREFVDLLLGKFGDGEFVEQVCLAVEDGRLSLRGVARLEKQFAAIEHRPMLH